MNKVSLLTVGKKLQDNNLYVLSIYDLEPSGLIVHAYDQRNSKEILLPVSEHELAHARVNRSAASLTEFLDTIELNTVGGELVLQSTNEKIHKPHMTLTGENLVEKMKAPMEGSGTSLNNLLITGLVELCKVKPVGNDAVQWLGEWLIENNPNTPAVQIVDEE